MNRSEACEHLRWFYGGEAEACLGLRGVSLEPGFGNDNNDGAETASRRADDCLRYYDISARIRALTPAQERILRVSFTPSRWPMELVRWFEFGPVAALVIAEDGGPHRLRDALAVLKERNPGHSALYLAARVVVSSSAYGLDHELRAIAKDLLRDALLAFIRGPLRS